jgi:CRP-like cAMP-binding protein
MNALELRCVRVLADLSTEQLHELAACGEALSFLPGKIIVAQGDPADAMYLIIEGTAGAYVIDKPGNETHLRTLEAGAQFGEIGLLESSERTATVRAITPCRVFRLDQAAFGRLLQRPALAAPLLLGISRSLAARLAHITNRFAEAHTFRDFWLH